MIDEKEKDIILYYAKKFNATSVVIFGSSVETDGEANDIDIGVKGIEPRYFFKFYAALYKHLSKPVDLIDISRKSSFNKLVEENGVSIYG